MICPLLSMEGVSLLFSSSISSEKTINVKSRPKIIHTRNAVLTFAATIFFVLNTGTAESQVQAFESIPLEFFDDFVRPNSTNGLGGSWDPTNTIWDIVDNRANLYSDVGGGAILSGLDIDDTIFETKVIFLTGGGSFYMNVRQSTDPLTGITYGYGYEYKPFENEFVRWKYDGVSRTHETISWDYSLNTWYKFKVSALDSQIRLYVDDVMLDEWFDSDIKAGSVGISSWVPGDYDTAHIQVDYTKVSSSNDLGEIISANLPTAVAGMSTDLNETLGLDGSLSTVFAGRELSYQWNIEGEELPRFGKFANVDDLPEGNYEVSLIVDDGINSNTDIMLFSIPAAGTVILPTPKEVEDIDIHEQINKLKESISLLSDERIQGHNYKAVNKRKKQMLKMLDKINRYIDTASKNKKKYKRHHYHYPKHKQHTDKLKQGFDN